jgi:GTP-binding protein Era
VSIEQGSKPQAQYSGFVAILGRPNVGKSTLMNRLLGSEISVVTPKAQTTRERVLGILTEPDRGQMIFVDTPGVHNAKSGGINEYMVKEAAQALEAASALWYLLDPESSLEYEAPVIQLLLKSTSSTKIPILVIQNKDDLERYHTVKLAEEVARHLKEQGCSIASVLRISGRKGLETKALLDQTWALLPEGPMYYPDPDQLSDRPVRFFVAEKIREQLLMQLGDELPYSCAVKIDQFKDGLPLARIEATIHVERDSQKGMVIGQGGQKIKAIGQAARTSIEKFMGQKVFLGLKVSVLKNWTKDRELLTQLGYDVGTP